MSENLLTQQVFAMHDGISVFPEISQENMFSVMAVVTAKVSFALQQNGFPVVQSVAITNASATNIENVRVEIYSSPQFFEPYIYNLQSIQAGGTYSIDTVNLSISHTELFRLIESEKGRLVVRLVQGETLLAEEIHPVELLAKNQWGGLGSYAESIAAFVQPNDPAIDKILGQASQLLKQHDAAGLSFNGYLAGKAGVWKQLAALWNTLFAQRFGYVLPPAAFEERGQKVRTPSQVVDAKLGTCLDTSLLCAACMEQIGLHPFLVFTKGHAFVGCWLVEEKFGSMLTDDVTALRKRLQLKELLVFETTLLTSNSNAVTFQDACSQGERNVCEDASDDFLCLLDVCRARSQHIIPLALSENVPSAVSIPAVQTIVSPSIDSFNVPECFTDEADSHRYTPPSESPSTPAGRIELWQRKLLDLSLRNTLLNFRAAKRAVELVVTNSAELEDMFADGVRFQLEAGLTRIESQLIEAKSRGTDFQQTLLREQAVELLPKKTLLAPLDAKELDSRLVNMYRAARSALDEGGANTLYLVLGFLSWKPQGRSVAKAPLLLLPMRMERRSVRSGFTLIQADDEPRFNLTLLEMLRKDYGLTELDSLATDLPTDSHGLDINGIWRKVQIAVKDIPGWEVSPTVALGLFSFAKYLMWKDLHDHCDILKQNSVVRHLLSPTGAYPDSPPFSEATQLDTTLRPHDVQCPLLADSSQMAAICSAAKGKDFVLIGPPGTGKSQTIANMIAQCLAEGKTVLFVAEKTAALNVVQRRLKKIGLGDFCLELHSSKANKSGVLAQLAEAVEAHAEHGQDEWEQTANRLCHTRDKLNTYVQHLHHKHSNGLTPYIAMGTILAHKDAPEIPLQWTSTTTHDKESYADLFVAAEKLRVLGIESLRYAKTALGSIRHGDWSPAWKQELANGIARVHAVATALQRLEAPDVLGVAQMRGTLSELTQWAALVQAMQAAQGRGWDWLLTPDAPSVLVKLKQAIAFLHDYTAAKTRLSPECGQLFDELVDTAEKLQIYGGAARQHAQSALRLMGNVVWSESWQQNAIHALRDLQTNIDAVEQVKADTAHLFGLGDLGDDGGALAAWGTIAATLPLAWNRRWDWVMASDADRTVYALEKAVAVLDDYAAVLATLSAQYKDEVFTLDLEILQRQWAESKSAWWPKNSMLANGVKKALGEVCSTASPDCEQDLPIFQHLFALRQQLEQSAPLAELTGGLWAMNNTNSVEIHEALSFASTLRAAIASLRISPEQFITLGQTVQGLMGPANSLLGPTGSARHTLTQWASAVQAYQEQTVIVRTLLQSTLDFMACPLSILRTHCADLLNIQNHFRGWSAWLKLCQDAERCGLGGMVTALKQGTMQADQCVSALHTPELLALCQGSADAVLLAASSIPLNDADTLKDLRRLREQIAQTAGLTAFTGGLWAMYDTPEDAVGEVLNFADTLFPCIHAVAREQATKLYEGLRVLLASSTQDATADTAAETLRNSLENWTQAVCEYTEQITLLQGTLDNEGALSTSTVNEVVTFCEELDALQDRSNQWCAWLRACVEAELCGLGPLVTALYAGIIQPEDVKTALRVNYARWWIMDVVGAQDCLKTFVLSEQEHTIQTFRQLDEQLRHMSAEHIVATLRTGTLTEGLLADEMHVLQRELQKKKRHMPLRKLVDSLPSLLPKLTPCFLMSPLSIAQYLRAGQAMFDVVIFDEASQIPVWDAIGAMARGNRVVVVGDPKQLPPTNFFQRADDEDSDDATDFDGDMESILDECLTAGLPSLPLRWHYRSRHEKLIVFSNHRYYDGKLVTFPSASTEDTSITLHRVAGVYERGTSRTNPVEARALVADVVSLLRSKELQEKQWSVGIVTFNSQQQQLIEDLLDAERRKNPSLETHFSADNEEPVIVKNLENIQGDERDIMYFSIGFAPDMTGHMTMNFGALNREGGERRLNVAITRARNALRVFCSLHPDQISLQQTRARGVRDLRLFLEFAEKGISALAAATLQTSGEYDSPFEEAVAQALRAHGWEVHPQVGVSAFRIDLGVVDPDATGDYLAGVECDGATYHRSATARDRDRLRENVLRSLGWDILRVWSTDWWMQRSVAVERLHSALTDILQKKREKRLKEEALFQDAALQPAVTPVENLPETNAQADMDVQPPPLPKTQPARLLDLKEIPHVTPPVLDKAASLVQVSAVSAIQPIDESLEALEEGPDALHMEAMVKAIVEVQSPIHADALCREVARQMGYKRAGSSIRSNVLHCANQHYVHSAEDVGIFFWNSGQSPETYNTFRSRQPDCPCVVDEIAMPELICLAKSIQPDGDEDPVVIMARVLGLKRLRGATRPRLELAWNLHQKELNSRS